MNDKLAEIDSHMILLEKIIKQRLREQRRKILSNQEQNILGKQHCE